MKRTLSKLSKNTKTKNSGKQSIKLPKNSADNSSGKTTSTPFFKLLTQKITRKVVRKYAQYYAHIYANVQYFLTRISRNSDRPLNRPTNVCLVVTSNCMLRCKQCDLWKSTPENQITFEDAKIIIDKLHRWLGNFYLFFTGGEPFMNQDLVKIIRYAEDLGIMTHVNSNAFIINPALAQKIVDSHLSRISISLDGGNAITHDHLRGIPGAFDRVLKGINLLQQYRGKDSDLKIYLNSVIMRPNVKELPQIIDVARANNVDGLTFQNLLPTLFTKRTTTDMFKDPLWPKFTDLKNTLQKIIKDETAHDILLTSNEDLKKAINYYKNPDVLDKIQCAAGINNFIINRLGEVSLCFTYPTIGNIFKQDPQSIWSGPNSVKQRQSIRRCKKPCKATLCNRVDTDRQKMLIVRGFEQRLNRDLQ